MKRKCEICGSADCYAERKRRQMRAYYWRHADKCRERARLRYWSLSAAEYAAYLEYCKKWRRLHRHDNH